jgi:hypothetical protein
MSIRTCGAFERMLSDISCVLPFVYNGVEVRLSFRNLATFLLNSG